jgi:MFS family permease
MRGRVAVLAERPFRLYWLGRAASSLGDTLIPVALPFAVLSVGGGVAQIGLVLAAFMSSALLLSPVSGVWADRLSRRRVMLSCDLVNAGLEALVAMALLTGVMRWWLFLPVAVIAGGTAATFQVAATGLVPGLVSPTRLQEANALLRLSHSATEIFGPSISGVLIATAGPGWVFAADATTFAVSASLVLLLRAPEPAPEPRGHFLADLAAGWRDVRSRAWLSNSLVASALLTLGIAPFFVLGPVVAHRSLGGAAAWGLIVSGGAVGGVAGAVVGYRLRPGRPLVACFVLALLGVLPALALLPPLSAFGVAAANGAFEVGLALGAIIWITTLQREIPPERLARVAGLDATASLVFLPLGLAFAGPLADRVGVRTTLLAGIALVLTASAGALLSPSIRELRATPTRPEAAFSSESS